MRAVVKPVREVLSGIPTAVSGFFASLVVAPWMRDVGADLGIRIGETMIVAMAGGLIARMTSNALDGVTMVTVQIVTLLIGTAFDNPKTLAACAAGLMLPILKRGNNVPARPNVR